MVKFQVKKKIWICSGLYWNCFCDHSSEGKKFGYIFFLAFVCDIKDVLPFIKLKWAFVMEWLIDWFCDAIWYCGCVADFFLPHFYAERIIQDAEKIKKEAEYYKARYKNAKEEFQQLQAQLEERNHELNGVKTDKHNLDLQASDDMTHSAGRTALVCRN